MAAMDLNTLNGTDGFRLDGIDAADFSGRSVSSAGDVNGDGFDDLIIGAPFAEAGGTRSTAATERIASSAAEIEMSSMATTERTLCSVAVEEIISRAGWGQTGLTESTATTASTSRSDRTCSSAAFARQNAESCSDPQNNRTFSCRLLRSHPKRTQK